MNAAYGAYEWLPLILRDTTLDATEKLLLVGLASHMDQDGTCFPSQRLLAEYAGVHTGTVRRRMRDLADRGVVVRSPRRREDGGRSTDLYQLVHPDHRPPRAPERAVPPRTQARGTPAHPGARAELPTEPSNEPPNERASIEPLALVLADQPAPDPFAEFWSLYPRKAGKPAAERAYRKVSGQHPAIMDGLRGWAAYWSARNEPEYVPHPATWLNQHRWNDTPPKAPRRAERGPGWVPDADEDRKARAAPGGVLTDEEVWGD